MLKFCRVTKVNMFFLVLVYVFNTYLNFRPPFWRRVYCFLGEATTGMHYPCKNSDKIGAVQLQPQFSQCFIHSLRVIYSICRLSEPNRVIRLKIKLAFYSHQRGASLLQECLLVDQFFNSFPLLSFPFILSIVLLMFLVFKFSEGLQKQDLNHTRIIITVTILVYPTRWLQERGPVRTWL